MDQDAHANDVARALYASIRLFVRRLRQRQADGDLTMPESSALSHLDRGGPMTPTALAKLEQITPQSMGATLASLEARGLVERRPDPEDGRRVVLSLTDTGLELLRNRRDAKTGELTQALATHFTPAELKQLLEAAPLIERLAQSL
ncbi:MAG: regulatory protein MarR [Chloroflexi bacterium]|jgi:DNA-binding MarR family transcriptional regulator|nr:regulatory protein MarR [Chloroflexota bacterium]